MDKEYKCNTMEQAHRQRYKTVPITYNFSIKLPLQFDDQFSCQYID